MYSLFKLNMSFTLNYSFKVKRLFYSSYYGLFQKPLFVQNILQITEMVNILCSKIVLF